MTRRALPARVRAAVLERDGHRCAYCGTDESVGVDHVLPVIRGGTDEIDNLAACCRSCNSAKGARTPEQWRAGWRPEPPRMSRAELAAWVANSRRQQGLPPTVQDPAALATAAALVRDDDGPSAA